MERDFFESFIDDALKFPPRIVMVDRRRSKRPGLSPDLDLFVYFCQSPRFAELMKHYHWLGRRGSTTCWSPPAPPPTQVRAASRNPISTPPRAHEGVYCALT